MKSVEISLLSMNLKESNPIKYHETKKLVNQRNLTSKEKKRLEELKVIDEVAEFEKLQMTKHQIVP